MEPILDKKGHKIVVSVSEEKTHDYVQTDDGFKLDEEESSTERGIVLYCPEGCGIGHAEYIGLMKKVQLAIPQTLGYLCKDRGGD